MEKCVIDLVPPVTFDFEIVLCNLNLLDGSEDFSKRQKNGMKDQHPQWREERCFLDITSSPRIRVRSLFYPVVQYTGTPTPTHSFL